MVLESVSIFPHGTMILDIASATMSSQLPQHTVGLHQASSSLASSLFSSNTTDYIFLITPHGIALKDRIGIYLNSSYAGSAEWNNCWSSYRVSCQNDVAVSKDIFEYLQSHDLPIDSIACFSQGSVAPLAWAEVVPLWFCGFCSSELSNNSKTKIIIFSLPTIRLTDPLEFSKIAFRLGELLSDYAISSNHQIAIMISADLSHVHSIEGDVSDLFKSPDTTLVPSPLIAQLFDQTIINWAKNLFQFHNLAVSEERIQEAVSMAQEAKSCGIGGCCIVQGIFRKISTTPLMSTFKGKVEYYAAPTYYGMMVAGGKFQS
eukprot:gene138-144_t